MSVNQGPQGGGVPSYNGDQPAQDGGAPAYANAFPPQSGGVPPYGGGYPPQQAYGGGYPPQQGGFPPQPSQKKPVYKRVWFWIVMAVVFLGLINALDGGGSGGSTSSGSSTAVKATASGVENETTETQSAVAPSSTSTLQNSKYGEHPDAENTFIQTIVAAENDYRNADTDLKRSNVIRSRNRQLSSDLGGASFEGWTGTIKDVGANGEGKAYVSIEIADGIIIKTWNNAISDAIDGTLIPEGSDVYNALLNASRETKITFDGSFVSSDDTIFEMGNLTEVGSSTSPDFIARITWVVVG
ncbi:hypothetical protein [uncultured Propionibacterium sp.]|uniref:hypothetical protein n=1 Tax=uncultured Propionibacterium sp. TaxID=218066 RepID=UPI00292D5ACE|nr:hypothetical protein [uncultured Propionibacterium sp.]